MNQYSELYIYWINRALTKEEEKRIFNESYIGNWVEDNFSFLFFTEDAEETIKKLIEKDSNLKILDQYCMEYEQWQGSLYDSIQIDKFLIIPSWSKRVPKKDDLIPIYLDPGVVFGNGLHPTTQHCISAISFVSRIYCMKNVLDLGTGTGILAIVAASLGAEKVIAVDTNPLCIKTAEKNVALNALGNKIETKNINAEDTIFQHKEADLVVANLSYEVILRLISMPEFLNKEKIILSGMLRSQWNDIKNHLLKNKYHIIHEWDHEMIWYTALAIKEGL